MIATAIFVAIVGDTGCQRRRKGGATTVSTAGQTSSDNGDLQVIPMRRVCF